MKNEILLTKPMFEKLSEHLGYMEATMDESANYYYPENPKEQEEITAFYAQYIKKVESILFVIKVTSPLLKFLCNDRLNAFPFVIIGSEVEVKSIPDGKHFIYRLTYPAEQDKCLNSVSYMSALGKQLILKDTGSIVSLASPSGTQNYLILSVRLI